MTADGANGRDWTPAEMELRLALRQLRREHGLSQRQLLRPLHLGSHSLIADWEAGRRLPSADVVAAYEHHFRLEPGQLQKLRGRALAERAASPGPPGGQTGTQPARVAGTPRQLPGAAPHFVGRVGALAELARLAGEGGASGAAVISAIGGMAGVGKTALAVQFAHQIAARFPDGQLYVNLRGFDPSGQPVPPEAAVRAFLDALEVPAARIPADLDAQAGLYRSLLADRRILVVLDNARDAAQVRPLLPGESGCLVLVTSRNQLAGLAAADGARLLDLDVLTQDEARQLLAARLGADRLAAEPGPAAEIINLCGRLPLALAIVAARAEARPGFPLSALAAELRDGPLEALAVGGDPAADTRAVFAWSYHALSPEAARLFRLLGLHPGPDISAPAAASLAGLPLAEARPLLAELAAAHLTSEHIPGRYALHDLVRTYSARQAGRIDADGERHAAICRLLDHYAHTAHAAAALLDPFKDPTSLGPPGPGATPEEPADDAQALAWLTAERPVLLAAVDLAADAGHDSRVCELAWALETFLDRQGHRHEQAAAQRAALAAAQRLADIQAQAVALRGLAHACARLGRLDDADTHLRHALDLCNQVGDQVGQARAQSNLSLVAGRQGRPAAALDHARQALNLYRAAGHCGGQANALNNMASACIDLGDYEQALALGEQALALLERSGNRSTETGIWDSLGYAHHHLGHHDQAAACYQQALALYQHTGERYFHADTLARLGDTRHAAGDLDAARDAWQEALAILDDLDHPDAGLVRRRLTDAGEGGLADRAPAAVCE